MGPILKYEDDLKVFHTPLADGAFVDGDFCYNYDREDMLRRIEGLGVPWHPGKGDNHFTFIMTFIGYLWDIPQKTVSLPETKHLKFREHVRRFFSDFCDSHHTCHLLDIQKLHGSLCHVAFIYTHGHSCLSSLSNFASKFKNDEYRTLYMSSHAMVSDLCWWLETLSSPSFIRLLHPRGQLQDLCLHIDASTSWGIGIVIREEWASFQLSPSWKIHGRDICWLETITVELLVYLLEERGLRDAHLLIHSDNQGMIGALGKGRSPNTHINLAIHYIHLALTDLLITPNFVYIESGANPADPVSREEPGPVGKCIFPTFTLPEELVDSFCQCQALNGDSCH